MCEQPEETFLSTLDNLPPGLLSADVFYGQSQSIKSENRNRQKFAGHIIAENSNIFRFLRVYVHYTTKLHSSSACTRLLQLSLFGESFWLYHFILRSVQRE